MSITAEIGQYIEANTTGFTLGTNLFRGFRPDRPNELAVVVETIGLRPAHVFAAAAPAFEEPRIQVITRSTDYDTARADAQTIFELLDQTVETTLSGVRYLSIDAVSSPFLLSRDEEERVLIACNYSLRKEVT